LCECMCGVYVFTQNESLKSAGLLSNLLECFITKLEITKNSSHSILL